MVSVSSPIPLDDYDFREVCNRGNRPLGASIKLVGSFKKTNNFLINLQGNNSVIAIFTEQIFNENRLTDGFLFTYV